MMSEIFNIATTSIDPPTHLPTLPAAPVTTTTELGANESHGITHAKAQRVRVKMREIMI